MCTGGLSKLVNVRIFWGGKILTREEIFKKWSEGRQRKTCGVDLELEVFLQYIYIFCSSTEKI